MTSEDIRGELEREPFRPFRLHLVSGKDIAVKSPNDAHLLQNSLMVFFGTKPGSRVAEGYDVISFRNIERLEVVESNGGHKGKKREQKR